MGLYFINDNGFIVTKIAVFILLLLFIIAQLFLVINFRSGTFNQYLNIDYYWRIQLYAALTRLLLLVILSNVAHVSAINLVLTYVIISILVAYLNTKGKILSELKYIFSNLALSSLSRRYAKIFEIVVKNALNGIFRSNRSFMETNLLPIYASAFLPKSISNNILLFAPFISATNNFYRTIIYKLDLRLRPSLSLAVFSYVLFILSIKYDFS